MILAGNQPYFIPYLGYWQLMKLADVFVIGDDYQYIKGGWINRNRLLMQRTPRYFTLELSEGSSSKDISEIELKDINPQKKLKDIYYAYARAPHFEEGYRVIQDILLYDETNLCAFLIHSMERIREYLGINTRMILTSEFCHPDNLKCEERIFDYCKKLKADVYVNAIGGQAIYHYDDFESHGIELKFLKMNEIVYEQFKGGKFEPNLSILDVIMFNSQKRVRSMLDEYTLIHKEK